MYCAGVVVGVGGIAWEGCGCESGDLIESSMFIGTEPIAPAASIVAQASSPHRFHQYKIVVFIVSIVASIIVSSFSFINGLGTIPLVPKN